MSKQKNWNTPLGAKINCPDFDPCPLCYGCRNYTSYRIKCYKCLEENGKENLCNIDKHTEKALSLMIKGPEKITIK